VAHRSAAIFILPEQELEAFAGLFQPQAQCAVPDPRTLSSKQLLQKKQAFPCVNVLETKADV
jgi:hypothetical protein